MRRLSILLVLALAAAVPVSALADGSPSPAAVAACKAEATQIGNDAFVAKYGPTEAWGHCYAQHAGAVTTTTTQTTTTTTNTTTTTQAPSGDAASAAACKAEYLQLGADAFKAKYGSEAYGRCVAAHKQAQQQQQQSTKSNDGQVRSVAQALCQAAAKEHAKGGMDACIASMTAKAKTILASCLTTGTSKDAFKACLLAAVGTTKRR